MNHPVGSRCPNCQWSGFPRRLWCPKCAHRNLVDHAISSGKVIAETTSFRRLGGSTQRPIKIGLVLGEEGEKVIVELRGSGSWGKVEITQEGRKMVGESS
jgi:uncharacterized OB-fold protein